MSAKLTISHDRLNQLISALDKLTISSDSELAPLYSALFDFRRITCQAESYTIQAVEPEPESVQERQVA
jgi:hypothetical protein